MKTYRVFIGAVILLAGCDQPNNNTTTSVPSVPVAAPVAAEAEGNLASSSGQRDKNGNRLDTNLDGRLLKLGLSMEDFVEFQEKLRQPPYNKYVYSTETAFNGLAKCSEVPATNPDKSKLFPSAARACMEIMDNLKKSYDEAQRLTKVPSRQELDEWLKTSTSAADRAFAYLASGDQDYLIGQLNLDASSMEVYAALKATDDPAKIREILEEAHKNAPGNAWIALKLASISSAAKDGPAAYQLLMAAARANSLGDPWAESAQVGREFLDSLNEDTTALNSVRLAKPIESIMGLLDSSIGELTNQADQRFKSGLDEDGSEAIALALAIAQLPENSDDLGAKYLSYHLQDNLIKYHGEQIDPGSLTVPYDEWRQQISSEYSRIGELLQLEETLASNYRDGTNQEEYAKYTELKKQYGSYRAILEIQQQREK